MSVTLHVITIKCQTRKVSKNIRDNKLLSIGLLAYAVNQPLNLGDLKLATIRSDKSLLIK